jgi:hypothetical protein
MFDALKTMLGVHARALPSTYVDEKHNVAHSYDSVIEALEDEYASRSTFFKNVIASIKEWKDTDLQRPDIRNFANDLLLDHNLEAE